MNRDSYTHVSARPSWGGDRWLDDEYRAAAIEAGIYEDSAEMTYTDATIAQMRENALRNFDLNMACYASLNYADFDEAVGAAVAAQRYMSQVHDLREWTNVSGLYVMVLDEVKQVYVGVADGVRARIRSHWSSRKPLDRLVLSSVERSILSIDSFSALDTTRIYAARSSYPLGLEDRMIRRFPSKYVTNRTAGGGDSLIIPVRRLDDGPCEP